MNPPHNPVAYKGRTLGIIVLVVAQLLIAAVHLLSGLWLLSASSLGNLNSASNTAIYSLYTVAFGVATLIFGAGLWFYKAWGWIGTVAVAIFVTVVDSLALLDLPTIPGVPKFAGPLEIIYSIIVILYLCQAPTTAHYFKK